MAEQLDRYELERKVEKIEFLLEEKTKRVEQLEQEHRKDDMMLGWQAEHGCKLEEKLQIAMEALELCVKTYPMCELREVKEAIKQIKGDDND